LCGRNLRDYRLEAREEQRGDVEFASIEHLQHLVRDFIGLDETKLLHFAEGDVVDDIVLERTTQNVVALAADGQDLDRLALGKKLLGVIAGHTDDRGVEAPCQTALAGGDDQEVNL